MRLAILAAVALQWGIVSVPVGTFRAEPRQGAELETQAPMGTPVQVMERDGEWLLTLLPDSVTAWTNESTLTFYTDSLMSQWRRAPRAVVVSHGELPGRDDYNRPVTSLVNGSIVEICGNEGDGCADVKLPDGRRCKLPASGLQEIGEWSSRKFSVDTLMQFAYSMMDVPYLWGGTSTKFNDCSGFSKICYLHAGAVILPRNSSAQSVVGEAITEFDSLRRGDLLFFLSPTSGRVNHVGIYDYDGYYIHSSGCVHVNNLKPDHPLFNNKIFSHGVRLADADGKFIPTLVPVASHTWYFDD